LPFGEKITYSIEMSLKNPPTVLNLQRKQIYTIVRSNGVSEI